MSVAQTSMPENFAHAFGHPHTKFKLVGERACGENDGCAEKHVFFFAAIGNNSQTHTVRPNVQNTVIYILTVRSFIVNYVYMSTHSLPLPLIVENGMEWDTSFVSYRFTMNCRQYMARNLKQFDLRLPFTTYSLANFGMISMVHFMNVFNLQFQELKLQVTFVRDALNTLKFGRQLYIRNCHTPFSEHNL